MHVYIEDIGKYEGQDVTLKGWLHNRRSSGKIHFLIVRDGTGFIQAVMSKAAVGDELFKTADHLSQETSIVVTGAVRADKRTPSGQLYNEANAMALGRVYCFGPTFRAEKSKTRRHLTEFWMVEPEMAYAGLDDVMDLAEGLVVFVVGRVLEKRRRELGILERDTTKLESVQAPFPRMAYDEAGKILK